MLCHCPGVPYGLGHKGMQHLLLVLTGIEETMNDSAPSWQESSGICFGSVTRVSENRGYRNFLAVPTGDV